VHYRHRYRTEVFADIEAAVAVAEDPPAHVDEDELRES
jgi:hypothetical protein